MSTSFVVAGGCTVAMKLYLRLRDYTQVCRRPQQWPLKCGGGGGGEISALYLDRPSFPLCDKRTENYDDGALNCRGERRKEQMRGGDSGGRQRSLL